MLTVNPIAWNMKTPYPNIQESFHEKRIFNLLDLIFHTTMKAPDDTLIMPRFTLGPPS